jgi:hypothetical protein
MLPVGDREDGLRLAPTDLGSSDELLKSDENLLKSIDSIRRRQTSLNGEQVSGCLTAAYCYLAIYTVVALLDPLTTECAMGNISDLLIRY